MYKLSNIAIDILSQITSMLEGYQVYKLFAAGDCKMNCRMKNGGVTAIRINSIFKSAIYDYSDAHNDDRVMTTQHTPWWFQFNHLTDVMIDSHVPLPILPSSPGSDNTKFTLTLNLPSSLLRSLKSLSLSVPWSNSRSIWSNFVEIGEAFCCLDRLDFSNYGDFGRTITLLVHGDDIITLPKSIMSTLMHLRIAVTSSYSLAGLPQNLSTLDIQGVITDFDESSNNTPGTTMSTTFPQTLSSLTFHFIGIGKYNKFQYGLFYETLSSSLELKRLDFRGKDASNFKTHLLPRNLEYLNVRHSLFGAHPISIGSLPQTLTIWKGSLQPRTTDIVPVHLPPSLKLISFGGEFDFELWANVIFPLPLIASPSSISNLSNLLIENIELLDYSNSHTVNNRHMVGSLSYNGSGAFELNQFSNCKSISMTIPANRNLERLYETIALLPTSLTKLILCEPCISPSDSSQKFIPDQFFGMMPKTLTELGMNMSNVSGDGPSDLCYGTDLAKHLPNLLKLNINMHTNITTYQRVVHSPLPIGPLPIEHRNGYKPLQVVHHTAPIFVPIVWFTPLSLPPKLKYISLSGLDVMLHSFLPLLPSSIEEVFVDGNLEDCLFETFMPAHIGSSSPNGISMYIRMSVSERSSLEQATSLKMMATYMRMRNNHLNVVDISWKNCKSSEGSVKIPYKKRVERE